MDISGIYLHTYVSLATQPLGHAWRWVARQVHLQASSPGAIPRLPASLATLGFYGMDGWMDVMGWDGMGSHATRALRYIHHTSIAPGRVTFLGA